MNKILSFQCINFDFKEWDPWEFAVENPKCTWMFVLPWSYDTVREIREGCDLGFKRRNKGEIVGEIRMI